MRRYLVIANQTLATHQLRQELLLRAEAEPSLFHFIVPDTAEEDYSADWIAQEGAIEPGAVGAENRLKFALASVRAAGASALGALGDPDPLQAVKLQVQCSNYDEIVVSMLPEKSSRWFLTDLPSRISRSVKVPVTTIIAKDS
jgi:hypothetical protein